MNAKWTYDTYGYHRRSSGSQLTSLQILVGNDWTGTSEIEELIQDAISKEERIQKEKDKTPSCYCEPSISCGHKGKAPLVLFHGITSPCSSVI